MSRNYKEIGRFQRILFQADEIRKRNFDPGYIFYRLKWEWAPRFRYVLRFPTHVDIETADSCNLRCIMCGHGQPGGMPDTGVMDVNLAKSVIDQASENGSYSIKFTWRGEALLHPNSEELVEYSKQKGIEEVQINTNGMTLNEKRIRRLIECGLDRIIFSIDGATPETLESIRIGAKFEKIFENVKLFHDIKVEMRRHKPFVRVQMVRTVKNQHEVGDYYRLWSPLADDIRVSDVTDRGQGDHLAVGDQVAVGRKFCPQPWQRIVVARDGRVAPCCSDWFQHWVLGDARKEKLIELWRGPRMNELRKLIIQNKLDEFQPCKDCYVTESFVWERKKSENGRIIK